MGAHDFQTTVRGKTAAEAYANAVEEAITMYGQDPYNGTISTTSGFKVFGYLPGEHGTLEDYIEELIMNDRSGIRKWENCGCIKVSEGQYTFFGWAAS